MQLRFCRKNELEEYVCLGACVSIRGLHNMWKIGQTISQIDGRLSLLTLLRPLARRSSWWWVHEYLRGPLVPVKLCRILRLMLLRFNSLCRGVATVYRVRSEELSPLSLTSPRGGRCNTIHM